MKFDRKNDLGSLGEVKSEQVQCMMGSEGVKVFEPSVLIFCTGNTLRTDQNTGRGSPHEELVASSPRVRDGAWV